MPPRPGFCFPHLPTPSVFFLPTHARPGICGLDLNFTRKVVCCYHKEGMVSKLLQYAKKPEGPLQVLQAELELGIQLVVHTLHAYKVQYLQLPQGQVVSMSDLGYEASLCNMALVNAAASWDGFQGNVVRAIRAISHSFRQRQLCSRLKQTGGYECIIEPLARRHCIVHNLAKVDREYKTDVPSSPLNVGDSLDTNLSYLKDISVNFFNTAVNLVALLVADGLLSEGQQNTIGDFMRDPVLGKPRIVMKGK